MITPPKTPKSNRKVTIPPFLAEELREYCSVLYGITAKERMFRFTKSFMEHEMVRGIKETGVKRIRLHDLRHPYVKPTTKNIILQQKPMHYCYSMIAHKFLRNHCNILLMDS